MNIQIKLLQLDDANLLYQFEKENKEYFETMVPSRGQEYYVFDHFLKQLHSLLDEQAEGLSYFYLIKSVNGEIVGRINLVDIEDSTGHLGYRVGEKYLGRGIASQAVRELLSTTTIREINAKTTSNNFASQRVLERNQFSLVTKDLEAISLNNQVVDFYHYRWER
ncbi:GNAT family N-acetyltransferase [Cytobacillus suaedae]|nr:GNAT family N-acetyltransferase [Cytobacillus suaedae]